MSEPQAEREIMDVLSSIRRLVSEDRRVKPAPLSDRVEPPVLTQPASTDDAESGAQPQGGDAPGSRLPVESRFVLTAALRVDPEAESEAQEAEVEPDWVTDNAAAAAPNAPPVSLEATIAELEAAVAGIEADFEPDGGDHAPDDSVADPAFAWIAPQAPTRGAEEYQGIIAGFDGLAPADDRLDLPIAGDAGLALPRHSADWRSASPRADISTEPSAYVASFQHKSVAARLDMVPEALNPSVTAPDQEERTGEVADVSDVADGAELDASEAAQDAPFDEVGEHDDVDKTGDDNPKVETHIGASRPTIFRHSSDLGDGPTTEEPSLTADHPATDLDDAADDLFDPLAGSDLDMVALREMVAEIVRDELRGTLGERITRNLRALVRREIARALEAEGLTRD